ILGRRALAVLGETELVHRLEVRAVESVLRDLLNVRAHHPAALLGELAEGSAVRDGEARRLVCRRAAVTIEPGVDGAVVFADVPRLELGLGRDARVVRDLGAAAVRAEL